MKSEDITRPEETGTHRDPIVEAYRRTEEAEDAWICYKLALSKSERDALRADRPTYDALSRLFFAAGSQEKLTQYANMTVSELARLAADRDAAALAGMDADTFARTVAGLKVSEPARLAAALARMDSTESQATQQGNEAGAINGT